MGWREPSIKENVAADAKLLGSVAIDKPAASKKAKICDEKLGDDNVSFQVNEIKLNISDLSTPENRNIVYAFTREPISNADRKYPSFIEMDEYIQMEKWHELDNLHFNISFPTRVKPMPKAVTHVNSVLDLMKGKYTLPES